MIRSFAVIALAVLGASSVTQAQSTRPVGKPNVIVILTDDMGTGDLSIAGVPDAKTPNIDSIATQSVRFTNGYASCPVCSPTRAGLMTGKYQQRFGWNRTPSRARTSSSACRRIRR